MSDVPAPFSNSSVHQVFDNFPAEVREGLLALRTLIFSTAQTTPGVGQIEETLKWGQPAYLTPDSKSGTTIRLGIPKVGGFGLYVHCQTSLISDFRSLFPSELTYEGNRAILFNEGQTVPDQLLRLFIQNALTYHMK